MMINQAWKEMQPENAVLANTVYNGMFDIDFTNGNGCADEVQFVRRNK